MVYLLIFALLAIVLLVYSWVFSLIAIILGLVIIYILNRLYPDYLWFDFTIELIVLTLIMFFVSYYLLVKYHIWFNWFIPIVIFYLDDLLIVWREYTRKKSG